MESFNKKKIAIGLVLFLVITSVLGYSFINDKKMDTTEAVESVNAEVSDDSILVIDEAGLVTLGDTYEKVIVNVPNVRIENGSVEIIWVSEDVEDGDVTLHNVENKELILQGGGENSIILSGTSEIDSVFLERKNGPLAVRVQDESIIENARVSKGSHDVTLEGLFTNIEIEASDIKVSIKEATIDSFSITGNGLTVFADKDTVINSAMVLANAENNELTFEGNVKSVIVDGKNNIIDFKGIVETVYVREGADNTVLTLSDTSTIESLIASVPIVLNGEGDVNKIVTDSETEITGTLQQQKTAHLKDKRETIVGTSKGILAAGSQKNSKVGRLELAEMRPIKPKKSVAREITVLKPGNRPQELNKPEEKPEIKPNKPEEKPNNSGGGEKLSVKEVLDLNLDYLYKKVKNPGMGMIGGDWSILSLARGGYDIPTDYSNKYYENVVGEVNSLMEKHDGKLDRNKGSEHSRLILGLGALGRDIKNVDGHDLRGGLADFDFTIRQGINGPIFALIALDSHGYAIPQLDNVENQSTRQRFIDYILDQEITQKSGEVGGWALYGDEPNVDITGMAIQGLTPYYEEQAEVKEAIDRALNWLASAQNKNGGYSSGWESETLESASQVVVALTGLGIDPHTDTRFIQNGNSVIDNLLSYAITGGGFAHVKPANQVDGMATDQGTYALVAYNRFVNGQNRLYDMTDIPTVKDGLDKPKFATILNLDNYRNVESYEASYEESSDLQEHEENPENEEIIVKAVQTTEKDVILFDEKLIEQKEVAQLELVNYKDISDYTEKAEIFIIALDNGEVAIDQATTSIAVEEALESAKKAFDDIQSDREIQINTTEEPESEIPTLEIEKN